MLKLIAYPNLGIDVVRAFSRLESIGKESYDDVRCFQTYTQKIFNPLPKHLTVISLSCGNMLEFAPLSLLANKHKIPLRYAGIDLSFPFLNQYWNRSFLQDSNAPRPVFFQGDASLTTTYTDLFKEYPHFKSLNLFIIRNPHPKDRIMWHFVLETILPELIQEPTHVLMTHYYDLEQSDFLENMKFQATTINLPHQPAEYFMIYPKDTTVSLRSNLSPENSFQSAPNRTNWSLRTPKIQDELTPTTPTKCGCVIN